MEQQYKYYYTYKITCTEGSFKDKIYYGQHKTNDLNDGYKGSGRKLLKYYKKYPTAYSMEIIQFYSNLDELNKAEYELIKPHLNKDYCLNLRAGGNQPDVTEEYRRKNSEAHKGYKHSEETIIKISNTLKGRIFSEETNKKRAESRKGTKHSEESKRKNAESHKGKTHSKETRKKQSEVKMGSNNSHAKQCYVNGKTYGCIKDAWMDICPELCYQSFLYRYKKNYYN